MSRPRFSVVHSRRYETRLAELYVEHHEISAALNELEPMLRSIPDQIGILFEWQGGEYWYVSYKCVEILYRIMADDCQVQLHYISWRLDGGGHA